MFALLQNLPHTKIQLFVTLVWSLWKSRNIQVWQNMPESSQSIVERAHQLLHGWTAANSCRNGFDRSVIGAETHTVNTISGSSCTRVQQDQFWWQKPTRGRFKCNVDASFSVHLNVVGYGMCIRDDRGNFVKARTMWSSPVCVSDIGEALGLSQAIQWVHDLQLLNVDFELDAKRVVDYFNTGNNDISEFRVILMIVGSGVILILETLR